MSNIYHLNFPSLVLKDDWVKKSFYYSFYINICLNHFWVCIPPCISVLQFTVSCRTAEKDLNCQQFCHLWLWSWHYFGSKLCLQLLFSAKTISEERARTHSLIKIIYFHKQWAAKINVLRYTSRYDPSFQNMERKKKHFLHPHAHLNPPNTRTNHEPTLLPLSNPSSFWEFLFILSKLNALLILPNVCLVACPRCCIFSEMELLEAMERFDPLIFDRWSWFLWHERKEKR